MSSSFQTGVAEWLLQCFGPEISGDKLERSDRFIEESLELVQAVGYPQERIIALLQYVYARPIGEPRQEAGGVMVTLAAFCWSYGIDLDEAARKELARIWTKIEAIRAKQAGKPTGSALPIAVQPDRNQFYSCLPCTWSSSDVDCCTYPADAIYVDNASTRFCADCANQYRGGTRHMRKLSEILSLARPHLDAGFAAPEGIERLTPDEAWTELCETPDVTSPEEYPGHALITLEQLRWFMERAIPVATAWPIETDDQVEALARECEWNNRPYMTAKDYSIWCERMRKFACLANGGRQ